MNFDRLRNWLNFLGRNDKVVFHVQCKECPRDENGEYIIYPEEKK